MTLGSRLGTRVLVCTSLALIAFAVAEDSLAIGLVVLTINGMGWYFNERASHLAGRSPVAMARWLSTSLLTLSVIGSFARGYVERDVVSSFLWLLASILLLKMWERRDVRDYGQMLTVGIFLTIGSTLSDNSLLMGVALLLQVPIAADAVMIYQLHAAAVRAGQRSVAVSARAMGSLRRIGLAAVLCGAGVAVVAFVLVPRGIGLRRFGEFAQAGTGKATGFVDEVDLDRGGLINESQTRVFDLQLIDGFGHPVTQDRAPLYLRGAVLDSYTGREWKRSRAEDETRVVVRRLTPGAPHAELSESRRRRSAPDPRTVIVQKFSMRQVPRGDTTMFCLWRPRHIEIPGGTDIQFDTVTARLVNRNESGRFDYTVTSYPSSAEDVRIDRNQRGRVPAQSARLTAVAADIMRTAGIELDPEKRPREDDQAAANAIQGYVAAACRYTLDVPSAPLKIDPVEFFLFDSKEGNCELFAATMVSLCRAAGIDARVIAGYMATEFDQASGTYFVRQSHAHAWCEVNTGDGIWETYDPTPQATMDLLRDRNATIFARVGAFFADLRDKWNLSVVTFDASSQQRLLGVPERDQPWYAEFAEAISRGTDPEHLRMKNLLRRVLVLTGYLAGGLVGVWCSVVIVRKLWGLKRQRRGLGRGWAAESAASVRTLHKELDRTFSRLGATRSPWKSLLAHSGSIAGVPVETRTTLEEASRVVYEATFSGGVAVPAVVERLRKQLRGIGR